LIRILAQEPFQTPVGHDHLEPKRGLEIYLKRMKIEQTFRDCKDLLHLTKLLR